MSEGAVGPRVLVTGAGGFIGHHLCRHLDALGLAFTQATRAVPGVEQSPARSFGRPVVAVGDIGPRTDWSAAVAGCDVVVHLANRAHVQRGSDPASVEWFSAVNVQGSVRLLEQGAEAGVRRMVYVSSIGVHGRASEEPCTPDSRLAPHNAYAISKLRAEQALAEVAMWRGVELVIVRPPLVHGPGVGANFLALARAVRAGVPLPFASVRNARAIVSARNLCDLLGVCLTHPAAPGTALMVSDGMDWATPDLVRAIGQAMGRPARLWPAPSGLLRLAARLVGRESMADSLLGSLRVDLGDTTRRLGWRPAQDARSAVGETVRSMAVGTGAAGRGAGGGAPT